MSDEIKYKAVVTSIGSYMQKEGDLTWSLVPGTALDEYTPTRLTNEQVEKYFKTEKAQAELDETTQKVVAAVSEDIRALGEALRAKVQEYAESFRAPWEQLQAVITAAEKQAQEPQRPDYKARPNCWSNHTESKGAENDDQGTPETVQRTEKRKGTNRGKN